MDEIQIIEVIDCPATVRTDVGIEWGNGARTTANSLVVGSRLAVLPTNFAKDTHDVLIVKKDARRVWVDNSNNRTWLQIHKPEWNDRDTAWMSEEKCHECIGGYFGISRNECYEFVQVATHRPPEPEKPVANSAGDLTCAEGTWLFPVIQIDSSGSSLQQVIEESTTIGTGVNGLAVGWRRTITTKKRIDPSAQ